jgi:hypothetical protein
MPIFFADVLQHSNAVNALVDSNYVKGGIRSSHATWTDFLNTINASLSEGQAGNISNQLKALSTMVWIGNATSGEFYVLTDFAGRDIEAGQAGSGWKSLASVLSVGTNVTLVDAADASTTHYVTLSSNATGSTQLKTDAGIAYTPSTNILAVTTTAAQKWSNSRTVTFAGGDVTGSFSIDGSADVSNVALSIAGGSVVLGTDTTGNYVASVTTAAASGISGGVAATPGANVSLSLDINGLTAESSISDTDTFAFYDLSATANRKATADNIRDYVLGGVSGNITINSSGVATIADDAVALGTKTSGDYVSTLTAGTGITLTNAAPGQATEKALYTVAVDYAGNDNIVFAATTETGQAVATDFLLYTNNDGTHGAKKRAISTLPFTNNNGTVTSVSVTAGSNSGVIVTPGGTNTINPSYVITLDDIPNIALLNSSITVGTTLINLGDDVNSLAGLEGLDFATGANRSIASSLGAYNLTLGGSSSTVVIPGNLTVSGTTTYINTTNTSFKDNFIVLNEPVAAGDLTFGQLESMFAGIYVWDKDSNGNVITEDNRPGLRYNYSGNKWEIRQTATGTWLELLTTSNQFTVTAASTAETLQGTITDEYVVPSGLRTWTAYTTAGIGISFPAADVSHTAANTSVQYAKTIKVSAVATADDATNGYIRIYHGLGNEYPVVFCYQLQSGDYFMIIPRVEAEDANYIRLYINGVTAAAAFSIGIIG